VKPIWKALHKLAIKCVVRLRFYGSLLFELLRQCAFSLMVWFAVVMVMVDFYRGRLQSNAVYFLIDAHSFFNSSAGKPLLGPLLVVAGGVVGLLTTVNNVSGRFFWPGFIIFSLSGLLSLWFLIQVSPPVSDSVIGLLEAYDINQENNQLGAAVSLFLVTLSAWLANRFRLRTKRDDIEETQNGAT